MKIIDGLSFELKQHEIAGLSAHSGLGRTTLVKILRGLYSP